MSSETHQTQSVVHSIAFGCLDPAKVVVDPLSLLGGLLRPSEPATLLCPVTDSNGEVTDVVECIRDASEFGDSSISMSLNRSPANEAGSIRGSSNNVPFYPGGFDSAFGNVMLLAREGEAETCDENEFFRHNDLLTCAPGMPGGVSFIEPADLAKDSLSNGIELSNKTIDFDSADLFDLMDFIGGGIPLVEPVCPISNKEKSGNEEMAASKSMESSELENSAVMDIQDALETPLPKPTIAFTPPERYSYAHQSDHISCSQEYESLLPNMAKKYPFELDLFQKAAVVYMERGESVFVAAHTSAGKTVVAEYAVAFVRKARNTCNIYVSYKGVVESEVPRLQNDILRGQCFIMARKRYEIWSGWYSTKSTISTTLREDMFGKRC
ncbi:hypothetical protein KIN20_022713 [Parelaphostrongylus tenuis]|uniref:Ski2 N-terminal domain-containing protein n=1 Tax=Parelaphostrongylus tenuis TaxID=148309 RepID=A0AAD5MQX5_PARTN|nr:hypothetical protein KIN20_022713 [Parelaphostrongylus tenuis]